MYEHQYAKERKAYYEMIRWRHAINREALCADSDCLAPVVRSQFLQFRDLLFLRIAVAGRFTGFRRTCMQIDRHLAFIVSLGDLGDVTLEDDADFGALLWYIQGRVTAYNDEKEDTIRWYKGTVSYTHLTLPTKA